jgi:hypothetical protein
MPHSKLRETSAEFASLLRQITEETRPLVREVREITEKLNEIHGQRIPRPE